MALERLEKCPICNNSNFSPFLDCIDHTASHEQFHIEQCSTCNFVVTNPRPDSASLSAYYLSTAYISHTGKSQSFIGWIYLQARKFTLRWKRNVVQRHKSPSTLLDYGCGTGEFLQTCQQAGWQIQGVEPSDIARQKASRLTGTNIASHLGEVAVPEFDVITLWHVLEHVNDLTPKLQQIKNLLKPDGLLFIAVPNHESHDAQIYGKFWAGYDVPRHLWHFSRKTMTALLATAGLKVTVITPMRLDSYYVSMLSEKYKNNRQNPIVNLSKGFLTGFISNRKANHTINHSSLIYIVTK